MKVYGIIKKLAVTVYVLAFGLQVQAADGLIYGATIPATYMLYIMDPDRLAGWNSVLYDYEAKYIPEKYHRLPVLGGWHGGGGVPDQEMLIKHGVKKAIVITTLNHVPETMYPVMNRLGIELTAVEGLTARDYVTMFRDLGAYMGIPERGEELALYSENALQRVAEMVKDLQDEEKPRIYMAEGPDGLTAGCNVDIIDMVEAVNVFSCERGTAKNTRQISFEQVVLFDPDVILISKPAFGKVYREDPKWQRLRAYKEGNIYVVPYGPFSWAEKPYPVKFMAIQWLACEMYPDRCTIDIAAETEKFMKLFLHLDLSGEQIREILNP